MTIRNLFIFQELIIVIVEKVFNFIFLTVPSSVLFVEVVFKFIFMIFNLSSSPTIVSSWWSKSNWIPIFKLFRGMIVYSDMVTHQR